MYVECFKNNGKPYFRLVKSVRVTKPDGRKIAQKQVVYNIGPADRYDDGKPDYVERLKKSFKSGNPLIPELLPYCSEEKYVENYKFTITKGSPDCFGHPRLFSHVLIERIIEELGLRHFFSSYKGFTKIKYDVYAFAKILIFGRILNPASKHATVLQNDDYYEPILKDFNPDNVYDTLSFIADNKDKIIKRINTNLVKKAGRSPEIIYYDVTNFYFEIDDADEDVLDSDGNIIQKGQRKFGVCKEERHQPIVQMGLFMDDDGIPISIESFPGNTLDYQTFLPALKNSIDNLEFSRFIMIADRGICNYHNLLHLLDSGHGYIISKSLLKSTKNEQEWTYSDDGYIAVSKDFKYKSRIIKKKVTDENGSKRTVEEKVVVYWNSFGYYQIVTSELEMDARTVIDKYHGLTQIEDQFKVMKSSLETRPLYVRTPDHVDAHLLICMISLTIMRIIQKRIRDKDNTPDQKKDLYWNVGMSSERIQDALNKWKVDRLPGDLYRFMDVDDPDLAKILSAFDINITPKLYQHQELKSIKTGTEIFM